MKRYWCNVSRNNKIIFAARKLEWYEDLVARLKEKYEVSYFNIPYFFEQQHVSKFNVLFDSLILFFYFPISYLIKGHGLYIVTNRHLPFLFWFKLLSIAGLEQKVVAMNFFFHSMREKKLVKMILGFLLDNKNLTVIAPSLNDYRYYRSLSQSIDLHYVIFGLKKHEALRDIKKGNYIFCGGYGNRDFEIVFDVAREVNYKFVVITSARLKVHNPPSDNVELYQDIPPNMFYSYLGGAEIVLIPLKDDSGASGQIVTLSAMLMGKPIIFTDYNVISEYFIKGVNGLSYKPGDRQDLKSKIYDLLENKELRMRLGRNAKEYCEKHYTSEITNGKIIEIVSARFATTPVPESRKS